jgi:hypothetical protein
MEARLEEALKTGNKEAIEEAKKVFTEQAKVIKLSEKVSVFFFNLT